MPLQKCIIFFLLLQMNYKQCSSEELWYRYIIYAMLNAVGCKRVGYSEYLKKYVCKLGTRIIIQNVLIQRINVGIIVWFFLQSDWYINPLPYSMKCLNSRWTHKARNWINMKDLFASLLYSDLEQVKKEGGKIHLHILFSNHRPSNFPKKRNEKKNNYFIVKVSVNCPQISLAECLSKIFPKLVSWR